MIRPLAAHESDPDSIPSPDMAVTPYNSSNTESSPFFSKDPRHTHSALTNTLTLKIEIYQTAAVASRTPGAVSPLQAGGTELLLESTAPIWAAQMGKVEQRQSHPHLCVYTKAEK